MSSMKPLFAAPEALATTWLDAAKRTRIEEDIPDLPALTRAIVVAISVCVGDDAPLGSDAWNDVRFLIEDLTHSWRDAGVETRTTSTFFRHLGQVLLEQGAADRLPKDFVEQVNDLVDELLLWSLDARIDRLNTIVEHQREEMEELSTPYIELFPGIAVLPLIGTLDSERAEKVMETLLEGIEACDSRVAVLDITGVPTVDAFVAERLVMTVAAAKLMGTHCIVSGVGSRIAKTMVRLNSSTLGVESTTKLSDALDRAFKRLGMKILKLD